LARILRVQRLLHLARTQTSPARLAELALLAGYTDQQHLTHDVGSIFGVTPSVLLAPVSDRCKTQPAPADPQWPGDRSPRR
jgi:AraC-like DNA-binding protein